MPDEYGNPTEAELRGQQAPSATPDYLLNNSQVIFDGVIGGKRIQITGTGAPLTQAQAIESLRANNAQGAATGAVDPAFWSALNPGMSQADQDAYKRLHSSYQAQTEGQQLGEKVGNSISFEMDRAGNLIKNVANDPSRLITGVDPLSTRANNTLFGTDKKPLVGQLGGATPEDFNRYEAAHGFGSLGAARSASTAADYIAGMFGARGAAHGIGEGIGNLTGAPANSPLTQTYRGGANLDYVTSPGSASAGIGGEALPEIVVEGTRGGLTVGQLAGIGAGVGGATSALTQGGSGMQTTSDPVKSFQGAQTGGNAGQLAQSGGISGGAGTGGSMGFGTGGSGGWVDNLIDIGSTLAGDYLAGDAAKDAGKTQAAAAAAAIAEERRQYDLNRADLAPYREAGSTAIGQLGAGTADGADFNRDFTMADFTKDPGYQFRMDEGTHALEGSAAARGGLLSGRAGKELERYGQDYASGEYSNAYNRFNADRTTRFNRLATVAGVGQTATNTGISAGSNSTNSIADLTLERANAQAAGRIGQANAYGQGLDSLANFYRTRKYGGANTNWIGG